MAPVRSHLDVLHEQLSLPAGTVIDVGCGTGVVSHRLADDAARVIGVDPSAAAIARARSRAGERERYLIGSAQRLPLPDGCANVVTFLNSLHHVAIEALPRALSEARRVLRPSGTVYVQEPLAQGDYYEIVRLVDDEREVRGAAQRALRGAERLGLQLAVELDYDAPVQHRDFASFRERVLQADDRRTEAFEARAEEIQRLFYSRATQKSDGWWFLQPTRVTILRRRRARASAPPASGYTSRPEGYPAN